MSEIKIEDLDDSFFSDLRDGNFILVLGAGFSFGVPNKAGGTIPIGEQFVKLTKERFGLTYDLDYSSAAEVWETQIKGDENLISEFKDLFLVDDSKFDSKKYAPIFLPKWYNIFTLNFDDVLEVTQKNTKGNQLKVLSYPHESTDSEEPDILHLHGLINNETTFDTIVFTPTSYAELPFKHHTLYNVLHGDVKDHKKNIVIVGSQFREITVRQKFFKDLPKGNNVRIFHFDIKTELNYVPEFTARGYNFILLDKDKGGIEVFLQFLQAHKDKIENIQVEGAEIINSTFIRRIREGKKFSNADFYTAKQDDDCQWFGIINNFDVVRNDYNRIRGIALSCFNKSARNIVVAVIHGFGGCGKSTLLRRLAVELCDEPFTIVWVKDRQFDDFASDGLEQIKEDRSRNYLVIIEDWYRIADNMKAKEFLLNSQSIRNLRIIIGDRETDGKDYMDYLSEKENQFHLQPEENIKIIHDILIKYPDWKSATERVLKNNAAETTSLFLLLFVIARINEEEFGATEIDFTDPSSAFKDIVKSDLKKINNKYPGLAKALHNWACIYTNYKMFIDFKSFLKIADTYNGNTNVSTDFGNWNANSFLLNRLKNYINVNKISFSKNKNLQAYDFIQFNHDKLAEDGLAQIVIEGWNVFFNTYTKMYDDILLKQFLIAVIEHSEKGKDFFSSIFLAVMLNRQKQSFSSSEKITFIKKLYAKGNYYTHYLNHLADIDIGLSPQELKKYLYELFDKRVIPYFAWLAYFKMVDSENLREAVIKILDAPDFTLIQHELVVAVFYQRGYDEKTKQEIEMAKHNAAIKILTTTDVTLIQSEILIAAFYQKGYDEKTKQELEKAKHNAAIKLLTVQDITLIKHNIIVAAFYQRGYDEKTKQEIEQVKHQAALKILTAPDITLRQTDIVVAAFYQKGHDEKTKQEIEKAKHNAAIRILTAPDINFLRQDTVVAAYNQRGYDEKTKQEIEQVKHQVALKILAAPDITLIQPDIVVVAFKQKGNDEKTKQEIEQVKYQAALKILTAPDITFLQHDIVVAAFYQKGHDEKTKQEIEKAKHNAAIRILTAPDITFLQHDIVVVAFNQKGYDEKTKQELEQAKHQVAVKILSALDITLLQHQMLVGAFYQKGYDEKTKQEIEKVKHQAALKILTAPDITFLQHDIVVAAFYQKGHDEKTKQAIEKAKRKAAIKILSEKNWNETGSLFPVLAALRFYCSLCDFPEIVNQRVNEILNSFLLEPKSKSCRDFYFGLMSIPFHDNALWESHCEYIIVNWRAKDRRGIGSVIHSNKEEPKRIMGVCFSILKHWKEEIALDIKQVYGRPHRGDHIILALGHPLLKEIALKSAKEMAVEEEKNPHTLPKSLLEIVLNIVKSGEFPQWQ